jgi:hypothetical protein
MSRDGLELAAAVFSCMQETRGKLLQIATKRKEPDKQDLLLAQLLETMKESGRKRFTQLTVMEDL